MGPKAYERKLAAVLSGDIAGYSRLMGEDDEATVSTLTGHRNMMASLIEQHRGRIVDYWNKFGWPDICRLLDNGDFEGD